MICLLMPYFESRRCCERRDIDRKKIICSSKSISAILEIGCLPSPATASATPVDVYEDKKSNNLLLFLIFSIFLFISMQLNFTQLNRNDDDDDSTEHDVVE